MHDLQTKQAYTSITSVLKNIYGYKIICFIIIQYGILNIANSVNKKLQSILFNIKMPFKNISKIIEFWKEYRRHGFFSTK